MKERMSTKVCDIYCLSILKIVTTNAAQYADILKVGYGPYSVEIDLMQPLDSEKYDVQSFYSSHGLVILTSYMVHIGHQKCIYLLLIILVFG